MLLGTNLLKKTKDEFLTDFADLAKASETLIFIDTNVLAYMFKLHSAAREEFFDWVAIAIKQNRLFLPAWCAGEYLAKVRENQLHTYTPKSKGDEQLRKALEAMLDTASLFVDEAVLKATTYQGNRHEYLMGFREAIDGLKTYTQAFKHQFDPDKIHSEIEECFKSAVLDSPIAKLCERAAKEGPSRIEHRLPPGYRDEGKPENRLGDLIIWLEVLEYSLEKKEKFSSVLFLTNDEKPDWVYVPAKRLDIVRGSLKPIPNVNPHLKIIDPRLVSEFKQVIGHTNISICTLSTLVQGLSKTDPTTVAQLAAAIQIEKSASEVITEIKAAEPKPNSTSETEPVFSESKLLESIESLHNKVEDPTDDIVHQTPQPTTIFHDQSTDSVKNSEGNITSAILLEGYRDSTYQSDAPGELNEIITSLKSLNWYTQNPAIEKLKTIDYEDPHPTSWFVLGRNIYQAACGNAQRAMDFLSNLESRLGWFPESAANYLLAGIVYEIYFDSNGNLRESPKAGYLAKPLALLAKNQHPEVCEFISTKLKEAGAELYFFPGQNQKRTVKVQSEPVDIEEETLDAGNKRKLISITVDGQEILDNQPPDEDRWLTRYRVSYSAPDILEDISTTLSIPRWALTLELEPMVDASVRFILPEHCWFKPQMVLRAI